MASSLAPAHSGAESDRQNDDRVQAEMLRSTTSIIENAKKVFGSSSLPMSFGKYDSFYSSLRDSEMDQRQKHLNSMKQMHQYRGDGTCTGSRPRRSRRHNVQHAEAKPLSESEPESEPEPELESDPEPELKPESESEDVPPSSTDDEGKAGEGSSFMSKVNVPGIFLIPLRSSLPSAAEVQYGSITRPITPLKKLADSFTDLSICTPESKVEEPMSQEDTRELPMPTPSPPSSGHRESKPYAESSAGTMTGQDMQEPKTGALNETTDEHILAPASGIRTSVCRIDQIIGELQTITDPYAECSPGASEQQNVEEEEFGATHKSAEDGTIAAAWDVEVSVLEHQLLCQCDDEECSQAIVAGHSAQEDIIGTVGEHVGEHVSAAVVTEDGTQEHQLQCKEVVSNFDKNETGQIKGNNNSFAEEKGEDSAPPEFSPCVLEVSPVDEITNMFGEDTKARQGVEKEKFDTIHDPADEHNFTSPNGSEEVQLQSNEDTSISGNGGDGESELGHLPFMDDVGRKAKDDVSCVDIPSFVERQITEIDDTGMVEDGHSAPTPCFITSQISEIDDMDMAEDGHPASLDAKDDQQSYPETEEVVHGILVESMMERVVLPSSKASRETVLPAQALRTTSNINSQNQERLVSLQQDSSASAGAASSVTSPHHEQVHNSNESDNPQAQEGEHNESGNQSKTHELAAYVNTQTTKPGDNLSDSPLQSPEPNNGKQAMPRDDASSLSKSNASLYTSNQIMESELCVECTQEKMRPENITKQHMEPPSQRSGQNAKSGTWKRKPRTKINLSAQKRRKLSNFLREKKAAVEKEPWGTGVKLYNGRSVERVQLFKKCKNKHCQWEPRAHSGRAACERCWTLASRWDREEFIAKGRHLRIAKVTGGCPPACTIFLVKKGDKTRHEGVRLCRRCFDDVHHVGVR